jgi:hypothetical protein
LNRAKICAVVYYLAQIEREEGGGGGTSAELEPGDSAAGRAGDGNGKDET